MSFLSRYWNMVEKQHVETGMNHGDIRIDPATIPTEENTPVVNVVDQPTETPIQPIRPTKDGSMPLDTVRPTSKFERGSARPSQRIQAVADEQEEYINGGITPDNGLHSKHSRRKGKGSNKTKATPREAIRQHRKLLKKLGDGHRVDVHIGEININGKSWTEAA